MEERGRRREYFAWLRGHHGRFERADECNSSSTGSMKLRLMKPFLKLVSFSVSWWLWSLFSPLHEDHLWGNTGVGVWSLHMRKVGADTQPKYRHQRKRWLSSEPKQNVKSYWQLKHDIFDINTDTYNTAIIYIKKFKFWCSNTDVSELNRRK